MTPLAGRRLLLALSLVLGLFTLVPALPVSAAGPATPPGIDPADAKLMLAQIPLDQVRDRVQRLPEAAAGLGGVVVSPATDSVTVYWKGALPADAAGVVDRATADGIRVTVKPAPHSRAELEARMRQIVADAGRYRQQGLDIARVDPRVDGTGLDVGIRSLRGAAVAAHAQIDEPAVAAVLGGGLPVRLVAAPGGAPGDRFNDFNPHWAGARIIAPNQSKYCSSGFPIRRNSDGRTFITTAGHCPGTPFWAINHVNGDNKYKFGDSWNVTQTLDVQYLRSVIEGRTYDGGVRIGTEFSKPVGGVHGSGQGDSLCDSGSATGVHCGITVSGSGTVIEADTGWVVPMIYGQARSGQVAMGHGDSGGPMFSLLPASHVQARGEAVYLFGPTFNYTNNNGENIESTDFMGFVDENSILANWGASIVTG
jgi:hypothetical protein